MGKEALVVPREILFSEKNFDGFLALHEHDFTKIILENFDYKQRSEHLENDASLKQIIPYVWIVNSATKKVFLYKRSTEGDEGRLHSKYSGGVGGHIEREDAENPITDAMIRELKEEITMENYPSPKFVGFLNDDSDNVGKVHFGVVAIAETEENVEAAMHMEHGKFYTIKEIENLLANPHNELENWSKLSWPFVKNHLTQN